MEGPDRLTQLREQPDWVFTDSVRSKPPVDRKKIVAAAGPRRALNRITLATCFSCADRELERGRQRTLVVHPLPSIERLLLTALVAPTSFDPSSIVLSAPGCRLSRYQRGRKAFKTIN